MSRQQSTRTLRSVPGFSPWLESSSNKRRLMEGRSNESKRSFHQTKADAHHDVDERPRGRSVVRGFPYLRSNFISPFIESGSDDSSGNHRIQQRGGNGV